MAETPITTPPAATTVTVSPATLALINQAESDLAAAQAADNQVTQTQGQLNATQTQLAAQQAAAQQAHQTATTSGLAAIEALRQELKLPGAPATTAKIS
jgi:hypothetical protein